MENKTFEFDIALSFAEEDRKFVECVAGKLRDHGIKYYFYGHDDQVGSWGKELTEYLDSIYRKKSRYCVVFISKHYQLKPWTNYERRVFQERAIKDINEYILPFRMDDTDIPGIPATIKHLSYKDYDCKALAAAIIGKVSSHEEPAATARSGRSAGSALKPSPATLFKKPQELSVLNNVRRWFSGKVRQIGAAVSVAGTFGFVFLDNLTPVEVLANRIHEQSKYRPTICRDGWISHSSGGRGTCSHHGGVHHISDTTTYDKTMEQCRREAAEISWLPE